VLTNSNSPALIAGGLLNGERKVAKVKMLRDTVASGFDVKAGKEYELDEADAIALINMGKAVPVSGSTKVENREEGATKSTRKKAAK